MRSLLPFLYKQKNCSDFGEKSGLFFSILIYNAVLRVSWIKITFSYPMGPFYRNMKLIKLSLSQETSPAWKKSWLHACLCKALINFAAFRDFITFTSFVKFIPTNLGMFQLGKVFFN